jgi:hypothetical protein
LQAGVEFLYSANDVEDGSFSPMDFSHRPFLPGLAHEHDKQADNQKDQADIKQYQHTQHPLVQPCLHEASLPLYGFSTPHLSLLLITRGESFLKTQKTVISQNPVK